MLPEITQFEETVTLISDTGIQFMDFALALDLRREPPGEFAPLTSGLLTRLLYNEEKDFYFYEPEPEKIEKNQTGIQPRYEEQSGAAGWLVAAAPLLPLHAASPLR